VKKKILAGLLALSSLFVGSSNNYSRAVGDEEKTITVLNTISSSYTVTINDSIIDETVVINAEGEDNASFSIAANNVNLSVNEALAVSVAGKASDEAAVGDFEVQLIGGSDRRSFNLFKIDTKGGGTPINKHETFCKFACETVVLNHLIDSDSIYISSGSENSVVLKMEFADKAKLPSGNYKGYLVFTFRVEEETT